MWRYKRPDRNFPFYSSAALSGTRVVRRRPRQAGARPRSPDRQGGWTFTTRARVDSSPVVAGGRVYVGSNDGKLYVLDAGTGKSVFEFEAGGPLSASPAVAAGRVVIGSQDGKLFCLGADDQSALAHGSSRAVTATGLRTAHRSCDSA